MMAKTNQTNSPLGEASEHFQVRGGNGYTGIYDRIKEGLLELYPAGYTQSSARDSCNRQDTYRAIWEQAVQEEREDDQFPFGSKQHKVELVPEPHNQYDKFAVAIILRTEKGSPLEHLDGKDLGYVPKKISKFLSQNTRMITAGKLFKLKKGHHKKYFGIKVIFSYGETDLDPSIRPSMKRFTRLAARKR